MKQQYVMPVGVDDFRQVREQYMAEQGLRPVVFLSLKDILPWWIMLIPMRTRKVLP